MTGDRSDPAAVRVTRSGAVAVIEISNPPVNAASRPFARASLPPFARPPPILLLPLLCL